MKSIWALISILLYFVTIFTIAAFQTGCVGDEFTTGPAQTDAGPQGLTEDGGMPLQVMDPPPPVPDAGTDAPAKVDAGMPMAIPEAAVLPEIDAGHADAPDAEPKKDAGCEVTHQTGVDGITFQSCDPAGSYSAKLADEACSAVYAAQPTTAGDTIQCLSGLHCGASAMECFVRTGSGGQFIDCDCWSYGESSQAGDDAGSPFTGHVANGLDPMLGNCACPTASSPTWN